MPDLFLSSTGLNQVTELIYLDSTRPWALKVFETLILNCFDHQTDAALHGLGKAEDLESQVKGDGPQSFSRFYEDLKEACLNSKSSMSSGIKWNHGGAHLNIINLFLCVAFLCMSKEADCDGDIEDTSENDNTASEHLSGGLSFLIPDRLALSSKEHIRRAADVWSVCHRVYLVSPVFQRQLFRLGGLNVCYRLMTMVLQNLTLKIKEDTSNKKSDSKVNHHKSLSHSGFSALNPLQIAHEDMMDGTYETQQLDLNNSVSPGHMESKAKIPAQKLEEEWLLNLHLLEALLSICLHSSKSVLQKPEYNYISFQVLNIRFLSK